MRGSGDQHFQRNNAKGNPGRGKKTQRAARDKEQKEATTMKISAPYNFVPLANWVHIPEWSRLASHDLPFKEGYSGEIAYRLVADSPLLVGGHINKKDKKNRNDQNTTPQEVKPFQLPDGRYALPGSSLKGMLRAVVEIAAFGRMRMVDDGRPGLRDITTKRVSQSYTDKVRDKVKTGFLRRRTDGGQEIVPCQMARLSHRDLARWWNISEDGNKPIFNKGQHRALAKKYARWNELCRANGIATPERIKVTIANGRVIALGGATEAVPVLTGQISDFRDDKVDKGGRKGKGKYKDFVFYDPDESRSVPVPQTTWRDFLHIHGDGETGIRAEAMSWPGYWKKRFHKGERIPVFYLQDGPLLRIGLAYMPKLAGDFSIQEIIGHASEAHRQAPTPTAYDLADLLFGAIGEEPADALRGRVSFETAMAEEQRQPEQHEATILNAPKPTYFPNYIVQDADPKTDVLRSTQYATYIATSESQRPLLRGYKRYPARPSAMTRVQRLSAGQTANPDIQVKLHTLPRGSAFRGRIVFHNLRPEELGALLWALTWGGDDRLRHSLGMGKPFGFGQVHFQLDFAASRLIPNDPGRGAGDNLNEAALSELMERFVRHMEQAAAGQRGRWRDSPQLANLLAMADPAAAESFATGGRELRHMRLEKNENEFTAAKKGGLALADYATAAGYRTDGGVPGGGGPTPQTGGGPRHPWLVEKFPPLMADNNITKPIEVWGGQPLAKAWSEITDPEVKAAVLEEIRALWQAAGWWDNPPKGAKRKAKAIYAGEA